MLGVSQFRRIDNDLLDAAPADPQPAVRRAGGDRLESARPELALVCAVLPAADIEDTAPFGPS